MPTAEQNAFVASVFGVDPASYPAAKAGTSATGMVDTDKAALQRLSQLCSSKS